MTKLSKSYTGADIQVLEGLEAVRKRPAMYIGGVDSAGFHHLLWEILDNSIDEVMNGFASQVSVRLHAGGKMVSVSDDGRGIPFDEMPKYKKSALELIFTTLHAGGKFEKNNYMHSGGLHGVGSSVVNALSSQLYVEVCKDGQRVEQFFSRGKPTGKLKLKGPCRSTGTLVSFQPDEEIFGAKMCFDADTIAGVLEAKSYLHRNLTVRFRNETVRPAVETVFHHDGGIEDFIQTLLQQKNLRAVPESAPPFYKHHDNGLRMEVALCWTQATDEWCKSYVNGIPTPNGGTHELGLRGGVVKAVRNYVETHNLAPKGLSLTAEDIREGMVAVLSIYVLEPQFQGQTKAKLNNPEVQSQVDSVVRPSLEKWLNDNKTVADAIVARIVLAAKAREASRAASSAVMRKTAIAHRLNLPGKLADCSSSNPEESELFIVEGDSAGGSAKQGRDRRTQAVLPLRGKVLNAEQASLDKVSQNRELQDIANALGCGLGKDCDIRRLRYGKIFLLMDADSDGHHIATLLLAFFWRHLRPLIQAGCVYIAQPPLFRVDIGKETYWAQDEQDKNRILKEKAKGNAKPNIMRFKGLGEMPAGDLKATTLDVRRRVALKVSVEDEEETQRVMNELLGKEVASRFRLIMDSVGEVGELDF